MAWSHDLSLHVTSAPYVNWADPQPRAQYHERVLVCSLSVIPEFPHDSNCRSRDPFFLLLKTSSLDIQRSPNAQGWLQESQVEVTRSGSLTADWKLILESLSQKAELRKSLILVVTERPRGPMGHSGGALKQTSWSLPAYSLYFIAS